MNSAPKRVAPSLVCMLLMCIETWGASALPPAVQADMLSTRIVDAIGAGRIGELLPLFDQYHSLEAQGVKVPPPLSFYEAKAADQAGDKARAYDAITTYLQSIDRSDRHYADALRWYPQLAELPEVRRHIAEVADLQRRKADAGTAVLVATVPPKYAEFVKASAALSPEDRKAVTTLLATGMELYDQGDCGAAAKALQKVVDLDPANVRGSYYLGECLRREHHKHEATEYLERAAQLGTGTPEAFKADAALEELSKPVPVEQLSDDEMVDALVGTWLPDSKSVSGFLKEHPMEIYKDSSGVLQMRGCYAVLYDVVIRHCGEPSTLNVVKTLVTWLVNFHATDHLKLQYKLVSADRLQLVSATESNLLQTDGHCLHDFCFAILKKK
jgi:tetratricopeptide (TPR) repeat protein